MCAFVMKFKERVSGRVETYGNLVCAHWAECTPVGSAVHPSHQRF